jgi:SAM-dependent methyltransferase
MRKAEAFAKSPLRLNLGSGQFGPESWVNLDRSPSMVLRNLPRTKAALRRLGVINEFQALDWDPHIVRWDVTKGLPVAAGTVDAIYSSHFLEHIYLANAEKVLRECARVLRPGGIIRLALPDAQAWAEELLEADEDPTGEAGRRYHARLGAHHEAAPTGVGVLLAKLGGHVHRWQPTRGLVRAMLRDAGFSDVTDRKFKQGDLPDLDMIETREESFFTEARR